MELAKKRLLFMIYYGLSGPNTAKDRNQPIHQRRKKEKIKKRSEKMLDAVAAAMQICLCTFYL